MAKGKKNHLDLGDGNIHIVKKKRFHIAQEYRDRGQHDLREESVRHLLPAAADAATGMIPGSHRYQPPPRGTRREHAREVLAPRGGVIG